MNKPSLTAADLRQDLRLYGRYCEKVTLRAQSLGSTVATHCFVTMLNPAYRGPTFRSVYAYVYRLSRGLPLG